ncbi:DotU/TssL family secretion system protein [Gallaecimonas kandeliae]|uniref:DotU family type IV/VI secretion system protein n=1 Tax=Gallaecimonas kandeliae TaxID=3029055 RepID=UPI0026497E91|nr:DotU/TssL family secretion system protein [Gallaecimonas kandeliae]WKE64476.1 DotU/TssL family secretion system protein [Gallaecimonas kandeliae]
MAERLTGYGSPLAAIFVEVLGQWQQAKLAVLGSACAAEEMVASLAESAAGLTRTLGRLASAALGAAESRQVEAVQFAFVALVDESLLFSDWPGRACWGEAPLEARLFGSRSAGERLPDEIEKLLREQEPATRELANVYLLCLALGFRGRLRGDGGAAKHEAWRRALFAFVYRRDASRKRVGISLEQGAVVKPARLPVRRMLPDGSRLGLVIVAVLASLLLLSHLLWRDLAGQVEPSLSHFLRVR